MAPLRGKEGAAKPHSEARCALEPCGRTFSYDPSALPPSFPFCSRRCKEVDLGMWVTDEYKVPGSPVIDEEMSELDLGGQDPRKTREPDADDDDD